jgi:hypothetical protein
VPPIDQLTLLAPGLLGGSVARAARATGAARRIVIWARRAEVRLALQAQPWCDAVADTPGEAARGARLLAGELDVLGTVRPLEPGTPEQPGIGWAPGDGPLLWRAHAHGFGWLRDLRDRSPAPAGNGNSGCIGGGGDGGGGGGIRESSSVKPSPPPQRFRPMSGPFF